MSDVPQERQCTLPSCEREAVDPVSPVGVCEFHQEQLDSGAPVTEPNRNDPVEDADNTSDSNNQNGNTPDSGEAGVGVDTETGVYPTDLQDVDRWLTWKPEPDGRKVPRAPYETGGDGFVSAQDAAMWTSFDTAREWTWTLPGYGLAFTIPPREEHPDDPYVLVDYDDVRDPETGTIHPTAREHLERAGSYADVSTSGTGVHIFCRGELPDGVKAVDAPLPDAEGFADAEIEVYDAGRYSAMTGHHIVGTPRETTDAQAFLDDVAAEFATVAEGTPEELTREPETPKAELADVDTTDDIQDILDAIQHTGPCDITLRSTVTHDRGDGSKSLDPSWAASKSGTRLAQVGDGWVYRKGMVGLDALQVVALEERIITREDEYPSGADFWNAVDALRERGAHIPEYEPSGDSEPTAPVAVERLATLAPHERKRALRKRGIEIPSTDEARRRLRDAVMREMRAGNTTLLDAPTALGKSHTVAAEPWLRRTDVTGNTPVVHFHANREAREDALATTRDEGGDGEALRGRQELSPLARGDHDPADPDADDEREPEVVVTVDGLPASEWFDRMCDGRGLAFSTALALARERNDQGLDELPPIGEEDPAVAQWDGLPRDDGEPAVDVIHATHQFAYVPSLRAHTNIVVDEQPDFSVDLSQERIRRMVTAYLQEVDAPVATFEAFVSTARFDSSGPSDAGREQDALNDLLGGGAPMPDREWYVEDPNAHALAPNLTRALWQALRWEEADANGRRAARVMHHPPRFDVDDEGGYGGTWLSVVVDEDNTIQSVRNAPDFSQARSVIGLDAHPARPMWDLNVWASSGPLDYDAVLDETERRLWRRFERGLTVVQVGDATRPRSGSKAREWMHDDRVRAVLERLQEGYGAAFGTAITTAQVEDDVRELLADVADRPVDEDSALHYGEEKSRNDFAHESAGYLYGCMDPGDEMILNALAELGKEATPATERDGEGELKRAKGRGFEGPDADTAAAVLASVRENHVAQAAGRYARNPDDPDSQATVYVHTDAAPTGFVDFATPGVEWLATETQRAIIDALAARPHATAREIADAVGCSKRHVADTLGRFEERGLVERHRGAGEHGADVWHGDDAAEALVDVGPVDADANRERTPTGSSSRWSLAISRLGSGDGPPRRDGAGGEAVTPAAAAVDDAPDPGGDAPR